MGKQDGYYGNPLLRNADETVPMTAEQIEEYYKCYKDPVYFIENYVKIINLDKGLMLFELYEFQKELIRTLYSNRFVIGKIARQSGKSLSVTAYFLHYIIFTPHVNVAILANKADTAQEILGKLQIAYLNLPPWLQHGIKEWNKRSIWLENGSRIKAGSTSSSAIRGGSFNAILLDEFAFVDNNMAEEFFRSVYPVISSGQNSKVFVVSTPNGMNHFFTMWSAATKAKALREKGDLHAARLLSNFVPFEANWWDVPGRNEDWKDQETANLGSSEAFEQEYGCEFIGSSRTLIAAKHLKRIAANYKNPRTTENGLKIYIEPTVELIQDEEGYTLKRPKKYVLCADSSYGKELDYSAFTVFDVSSIPYCAVATYRDNKIPPILYPSKLVEVAKKYHDAFILCETNDIGGQVAQAIHYELEYENLLKVEQNGRSGQMLASGFKKGSGYGLKMSSATKRTGCSNLKSILENDKLVLFDLDTIKELTMFVQSANSYSAEDGANDDLVMTLVMFSWLVLDRHFKEIIESDIRKSFQKDNEEFLKNDSLPDFYFDDGQTQEYEMGEGLIWEKIDKPFWNW